MTRKQKSKVVKIFALFIAMFLGILKVEGAECTYTEKAKLNEIASKVKTNYEIVEEKVTEEFIDPDTLEKGTYETIKISFKIGIYNITKDLYITQTNSLTKESEDIFYENTKDGVYTFVSEDIENIIKYEYKIYSNLENCTGEILKNYSFTKPKINMYSQYRICQGLEDVPYCRKYITEEIKISESELASKLNEYLKEEKPGTEPEEEGIKDFIKSNYGYIIAGVGIVAGTLGITIVIVKKRSAL